MASGTERWRPADRPDTTCPDHHPATAQTTNYPSYATADAPTWPACRSAPRSPPPGPRSGGHRGDLPILTPDQVRLLADEHHQLVARHLLPNRHQMITAQPSRARAMAVAAAVLIVTASGSVARSRKDSGGAGDEVGGWSATMTTSYSPT